MSKIELNIEDFFKQVIKVETEKYFEENKAKYFADISGRVAFVMQQAMDSLDKKVIIQIKHATNSN